MTYHIARYNQKIGIFSTAEILGQVACGEILPSDLCWTENMSGWKTVAEVFSRGVTPEKVLPTWKQTCPVATSSAPRQSLFLSSASPR
ncbi:MAG: GYF domain-containing protein [Puniceicoccales bacterium]|nr:GYF domain-containing protein [Puniceicoccales bacterium]